MTELFGLGLFGLGLGLGLFGSVFGLRLIMPRVSSDGIVWPRRYGIAFHSARLDSC